MNAIQPKINAPTIYDIRFYNRSTLIMQYDLKNYNVTAKILKILVEIY